MKTLLKIVIGLAAAFLLAIGVVFWLTSGMATTANNFFTAVKKQDIGAARNYLAEDFKASTDEKALTEFLTRGAILHFRDTSWSERKINGGRGELDGSIHTDSGGVVPIKLMFVKENGAWKIYAIQKPTAGLQAEDSSPTAPNKANQLELVKRSMHDFALSVNSKSMEHFRGTVSQLWRRQATTQQLDDSYGKLYSKGVDLTSLDNLEPVIENPGSLGENGELVLKGYYPTQPGRVTFNQSYIYEGTGWKLFGFGFNIVKAEPEASATTAKPGTT